MGTWLKANGDAIYGTTASPFSYLSWGVATRKGDKLYLHVFDWPAGGELRVPLKSAVKKASLLAAPSQALSLTREADRVVVKVPATAPDSVASVVVLELGGEPVTQPLPTAGRPVTASSTAAGSDAANVTDGTQKVSWSAADGQTSAWLEFDLGAATTISGFAFDEPDVWPRLKQTYRLEVADGAAGRRSRLAAPSGTGTRRTSRPSPDSASGW